MSKYKLPRLFAQERFRIPKAHHPDIVYEMGTVDDFLRYSKDGKPAQHWHPGLISLAPKGWLEFNKWGLAYDLTDIHNVRFQSIATPQGGKSITRDIYYADLHDANNVAISRAPEAIAEARKYELKIMVLTDLYLRWLGEQTSPPPVSTGARNQPSAAYRIGDTIRYARCQDLTSTITRRSDSPPSGIRKREHSVRGHWVTRNGVRFWRKSHKRGDPDLGRVTRVLADLNMATHERKFP